MITYYDDKSVRVTSDAFRVHGRSYPLAELDEIWHQRGRRSWRIVASRGGLIAAIAGPVFTAALGILLAIRMRLSPAVTIAVVGVLVLIGLAAGPVADLLFEYLDRSYVRGAHRLEIWARWRGTPVRLLQTHDALRFGQIYRALQRAMERVTPGDVRSGPGRAPPRAGWPARRTR